MRGLVLLAASAVFLPAHADEGMWTFDNFPSAAVKRDFGADITPAWLDHVRQSTLRLTNCTASFVSPEGLILTNHHCIESCLAELSSKEKSLLELGFNAPTRKEELRCPAQHADVLVGTENVTDEVLKAGSGLGVAAANDARKKLTIGYCRSRVLSRRTCISRLAGWGPSLFSAYLEEVAAQRAFGKLDVATAIKPTFGPFDGFLA